DDRVLDVAATPEELTAKPDHRRQSKLDDAVDDESRLALIRELPARHVRADGGAEPEALRLRARADRRERCGGEKKTSGYSHRMLRCGCVWDTGAARRVPRASAMCDGSHAGYSCCRRGPSPCCAKGFLIRSGTFAHCSGVSTFCASSSA